MASAPPPIVIVGGGLAGSLLAILLARRGSAPLIVEKRRPYSGLNRPAGRSINLALAERGIRALRCAEIYEEIAPLLLPMRGRMVHEKDRSTSFRPYGRRPEEQIYSVSRADLNLRLYELAHRRFGVEYRFEHECVGVDASGALEIVDATGARQTLAADLSIGADGAGSAVRRGLEKLGAVTAAEHTLDHAYKEFDLPPASGGGFALEPTALHIWPRGEFMLIALPNLDHSFTATLFLPLDGRPSFASVERLGVRRFFADEFPDAAGLLGDLERQDAEHPTGSLGWLSCRPWSYRGRILLLGDAAHAIVPFHGQGMNAAFEDCVELDRLIASHGRDYRSIVERFETRRAANSRAIAEMALENYREMRDEVREPRFRLKAELSFELERRFPDRFIPRYSMVMFHPEIEYAEAQRRGAIQARLLDDLLAEAPSVDAVDFDRAAKLIEQRLQAKPRPAR